MRKRQTTGAIARPFLKWAGGKSQLLEQFELLYPHELKEGQITKYCEPFLGSGAVFFRLAGTCLIRSAHLFDINPDLVVAFRVVQTDVEPLIERLKELASDYLSRTSEKREERFYDTRNAFNDDRTTFDYSSYSGRWVQRTAWLLFLNRTCFNGLYRVNRTGNFNVPFGRYKNPAILDEENLRAASKVLAIAEIRVADFEEAIRLAAPHTFIYLDPPYRPLSMSSSFTSYSKDAFDDEQQHRLGLAFREMDKKGARLMLSNSDPRNTDPQDNFFDDLYAGFTIQRVSCRRTINSKGDKRGEISEIVVMNYAPEPTGVTSRRRDQSKLFVEP